MPRHLFEAVTTKSTDYTATLSDAMILVSDTATITLPTASGVAGREYTIKNTGTGTVTIDGNGSETIDGGATATILKQYESVTVVSDGTNWIIK